MSEKECRFCYSVGIFFMLRQPEENREFWYCPRCGRLTTFYEKETTLMGVPKRAQAGDDR
jgi:hypothetical protein